LIGFFTQAASFPLVFAASSLLVQTLPRVSGRKSRASGFVACHDQIFTGWSVAFTEISPAFQSTCQSSYGLRAARQPVYTRGGVKTRTIDRPACFSVFIRNFFVTLSSLSP
jgi:hypothetical protein